MVKMQNVAQGSAADNPKLEKVNVQHGSSSTPHSATSSPAKSETETYSEHPRFMTDSSESEEDSVSEVESFIIDRTELDEDEKSKFLLGADEADRSVDPETQARLEALLHAAGISQLATKDGKHLADPEVLRRLTSSVSCALDEAAAALTRMRTDNPRASSHSDKTSLVEACTDGDVGTVRKLLTEGRSVHETTEDGESLLSLACSAGYFELAQVLLAMHANVEDRGIKGECTPLMEAASAGHIDIVRLLIAHGADVNAQSTSGNTPLMYACAGGHEEAVETLLDAGANVEDHNENGHTPLMEAASAGHVNVAKILLRHGAGINTHSNEFKESALTLACYKGHLDMVRFLLEAGADQEHKTDEMHTALMEASMDGHVEVARLLLDSGAQVNMPTDSFESPLTLAACGGHVDLAMLLIERGANIEEVNDEGYTPLMEAAREGHEEMVALLLSQGANINAQTDETQETALTLACCGGFSEVADFLIKAGADIELGASTPLMEAAQEGHLELVKYLLQANANVHAQTQTGDTALTYACENGHTDVADLLLECNADLEHESEGGRTPLMKACRAGHLCTVQFLISKGANVNRQTTNNDHTPLSLACAGGHLQVVELLLSHQADPFHKLKDNSTMLIEAAKGGHTSVVQLLLDYPHSILMTPSQQQQQQQQQQQHQNQQQQQQQQVPNLMQTNVAASSATGTMPTLPPTITVATQPFLQGAMPTTATTVVTDDNVTNAGCQGLHEVPEAVRIVSHEDGDSGGKKPNLAAMQTAARITEQFVNLQQPQQPKPGQKSLLRKNRSAGMMFDNSLTSAEAQQVRTQPLGDLNELGISAAAIELLSKDDGSILDKGSTSGSIIEYIKTRRKLQEDGTTVQSKQSAEEHILQKQQILEELHRVERELQVKAPNQLVVNAYGSLSQNETLPTLPGLLNIDIASHTITATQGMVCGSAGMSAAVFHPPTTNFSAFYTGKQQPTTGTTVNICQQQQQQLQQQQQQQQGLQTVQPVQLNTADGSTIVSTSFASVAGAVTAPQVITTWQPTTVTATAADVSQNTAISDRPKAKPVSKKEGKNLRKQQAYQAALQQQQNLQQINQQLQQQVLQQQQQLVDQQQTGDQQTVIQHQHQQQQQASKQCSGVVLTAPIVTHILESNSNNQQQKLCPQQHQQQQRLLQSGDTTQDLVGLLTDQECHLFSDVTDKTKLENVQDLDTTVEDVVQTLETFSLEDVANVAAAEQEKLQMAAAVQHGLQVQSFEPKSFEPNFDETMNALAAAHSTLQVGTTQTDVARVEYFAVPTSNTQMPTLQMSHGPATGLQLQYEQYLQSVAGNEQVQGAMYQAGFQAGLQLCQEMHMGKTNNQQLVCSSSGTEPLTTTISSAGMTGVQSQVVTMGNGAQYPQTTCTTHQVQVATQTQQQITPTSTINPNEVMTSKKSQKQQPTQSDIVKVKKGRLLMQRQQSGGTGNHLNQQNGQFATNTGQNQNQNFQIDPNTGQQYASVPVPVPVPQTSFSCMDVDSETDSNHDTALTLACAGGHEDLVELLLQRGADIEHRDKKGFTPLILAATAGHEKVVEILLNHGADIEAQSERTKDTPLSLACSGGRYEVVDLLLSRGANKEHRNVSDYTPLSLAASGGYVNIIKLLLSHGAEINSRTGSKLGISPLMLAAMNGHTAAVKLLLDMGSDINAQIETNRNTALTLACFQGRHEVVSLLLDRKANVEHRAKTGLTPLMEAASGGYVEVGRVLLDKGADVNATPVPSSRDTALTIAADKGHCRFVELLLSRGAAVEVKNKKGNSPLWLAANGGHISVVELLYNAHADIDSQDNRKVSCLMAAFRKGHTKVVKWMVNHVTQFPSDQEMISFLYRYISTVSDKELLEKCQECVKIIRAAKETQAAKANKNASILLEELDMEKNREESKKAAAARRRERKKKKKLEKKEEKRKLYEENRRNETYDEKDDKKSSDEVDKNDEEEASGENTPAGGESPTRNGDSVVDKEEGDSGIDANSQGSCSSNDVKAKEKRKEKKKKKNNQTNTNPINQANKSETESTDTSRTNISSNSSKSNTTDTKERLNERRVNPTTIAATTTIAESSTSNHHSSSSETNIKSSRQQPQQQQQQQGRKNLVFESSRHPAERDEFEATGNETYVSAKGKKTFIHYENDVVNVKVGGSSTSPKQSGKREEGWKEVVRKSSVQAVSSSDAGTKKVSVPLNAISRVIGRGGSNINAIRGATGAHIEVEKQSKGQGERIITIKGSAEATKQAHTLIGTLIKDPDVDILSMLPKTTKTVITSSLWDKTNAALAAKKNVKPASLAHTTITQTKSQNTSTSSSSTRLTTSVGIKPSTTYAPLITRGTAPRLVAAAEKRVAAQLASNTKNTMSYTSAIMTAGRGCSTPSINNSGKPVGQNANCNTSIPVTILTQTFAAKLTDNNSNMGPIAMHSSQSNVSISNTSITVLNKPRVTQALNVQLHVPATAPVSPQANNHPPSVNMSPKHHHRPLPTASAPPNMTHYQQPGKTPFSMHVASTSVANSSNANSSEMNHNISNNSISSSSMVNHQQSVNVVNAVSHSHAHSHSHSHSQHIQSTSGQLSHSPESNNNSATHSSNNGPNTNQNPNTMPNVSSSSTPQEYSLFNDSFSKVTQQSMWGRENEHKPINFATVTGGCINSQSAPPKFIDNDPPQMADASKAPGYRGTTVCSPVSSKTSSNSTTPPTLPLAPGTGYHHNFPEQQKTQPIAGMNLNRPVSRPGVLDMSQTNPMDHYVSRGQPVSVYQSENNINPVRSSGQSVDNNLYKNVSSTNFLTESATNLLKMVPGNDSQQPHGMMFHQQASLPHHINYSQPQPSSNPTVSMSRLNPRAPDFSLHNIAANKQQQSSQPVTMFNTPGYHHSHNHSHTHSHSHSNVISNQNSGQNQVIGNANVNVNVPYPMKSSLNNYRTNNASQQNRWQFMGPPSGYLPQQQQNPDMMVQMSHLRGMGLNHPQMDLLENGGINQMNISPAMSPNSPAGMCPVNPSADQHHKLEDRKIPQPIGTERKQQSNTVPPGNDPTDINWILGNESKIAMGGGWTSSMPNMDRQQQMFRSSFRMPTGDEMTHIIDSYQHGGGNQFDNQHVFQNGTVAAMGLMPNAAGLPPLSLQQAYGGPVTDMIQTAAVAAAVVGADPMKMAEIPQWDGGRMSVNEMNEKHVRLRFFKSSR